MHVIIDNFIIMHESPFEIESEVKKTFTIDNPEWLENNRMGRWNGDTPQRLRFWKLENNVLVIPRAAIGLVIDMCRRNGYHYHVDDRRRTLSPVDSLSVATCEATRQQPRQTYSAVTSVHCKLRPDRGRPSWHLPSSHRENSPP